MTLLARFAYKRAEAGFDERWYRRMRTRAHAVLAKYVRIKPHISREVDDFWRRELSARRPVLGLHVRGTDKQAAIAGEQVLPQAYVHHIEAYLAANPDALIFVATDSPSFWELLRARYPRAVSRGALRSEQNAFLDSSLRDNYRKGADALIDSLLLSRCDFLLKCSSALGEFAVYFNPALHSNSIDVQLFVEGPDRNHNSSSMLVSRSNVTESWRRGVSTPSSRRKFACVLQTSTDFCSLFVSCDAPIAYECAPGESARGMLEAYGVFRSMYGSIARNVPPQQLPAFSSVLVEANKGCAHQVDLVFRRCQEPLLQFVFDLVARASGKMCFRVLIHELCASVNIDPRTPLDSRDRFMNVRRVSSSAASLKQAVLTHDSYMKKTFGGDAEYAWFFPMMRVEDSVAGQILRCSESALFWDPVGKLIKTTGATPALRLTAEVVKAAALETEIEELERAAQAISCPSTAFTWRKSGDILRYASALLLSQSVDQVGALKPWPVPRSPSASSATLLPAHPPAIPLDCLEVDFMLYNRHLLPRTINADEPCKRSRSWHFHDISVQAIRLAIGRESVQCACSDAIRTRLLPAGWFSTLHGLVKPAMHALMVHRQLLTPPLLEFTAPRNCTSRDLSCFFEPLASCEGNPSDAAHVDLRDTSFIRNKSYAVYGKTAIPPSFRQLGWYRWTITVLYHLLRPKAILQQAIDNAMRDIGLANHLSMHRPILGLHVRHGDACLRKELRRMARTCTSLEDYMHYTAPLARAHGISTIYLATDSKKVLADTKKFPEFSFLHLPAPRYVAKSSSQAKLWDTLVAERALSEAVHENFEDAWRATIDAMLLSKCHMFVGKFTSTFFRTAYALHSAECNCLAPFISLDSPWCFDYGERAGSNWEFPVKSRRPSIGSADNHFWC